MDTGGEIYILVLKKMTSIIYKDKEVENKLVRFLLKWFAATIATFAIIFAVLMIALVPIWVIIDIPLKVLGFRGIIKYSK